MTLIREIDLGAEALRVCMCQATVCVGFREEYRIFKNVVGGPVAESVLFAIKNTPPNARPRPPPPLPGWHERMRRRDMPCGTRGMSGVTPRGLTGAVPRGTLCACRW